LAGTVIVAAGLMMSFDRNSVASVAIISGSVLIGVGSLLPWLRRMTWGSGSVELEDPKFQRAQIAQETAEEQGDREVTLEDSEVLDANRHYAASLAFDAIVADAEALNGCEFRFYMWDDHSGRLVAAFRPPDSQPGVGWLPGQGVTGAAFEKGRYVLATGPATHDGTHSLTPEMQARYANLTEVAAAPVRNAAGTTIGVLSVSNRTSEQLISTMAGFEAHVTAASALARIVVDLLLWQDDG